MNIELSVTIMAHPKRIQMVKDNLLPQLSDKRIKNLSISWDTQERGIWWNSKRSWMEAKGTHHLVISDDAVLCNYFVDTAYMVLEANPTAVIGWYGNVGNSTKALLKGEHWIICKNGVWGLVSSMPVETVWKFLEWEREHIAQEFNSNWTQAQKNFFLHHDDRRLALFLDKNNITCWQVIPSLVQHGGRNKSLIGHNVPASYSHVCAVDGEYQVEDPRKLDWTVPKNPYRSSASISFEHWKDLVR